MKRIFLSLAIVALFAPQLGIAQSADPTLEGCTLSFLPENYIEISSDKAGVLRQLTVREGSRVADGAVIAQIDNEEAKMQLHVADQQRLAAAAKFHDEIEKKYAEAASAVARADYEDLQEANSSGVDGVVTDTDLRRARLEWDRAKLQIEKATKDKQLAGYEYMVRKAEMEAAQMEIDRRIVKAPFGGQVMELFRKQGEWVDPGEPILQYARFDMLQCDGKVYLDEYDPREIEGCEVTIEAVVGRNETQTAKGRIIHVDQQVQYEGRYTYRVLAEVPNKMDRNRWALFPGLNARMTIHLGTTTPNLSRVE